MDEVKLDIDLGEHGDTFSYAVDATVYSRGTHLDKYGSEVTDLSERVLTLLSSTNVHYHDGENSTSHILVYAPDLSLDELTELITHYVFPAHRCWHDYDCCGCSFYNTPDIQEIGYGDDMYLVIQSRGVNI